MKAHVDFETRSQCELRFAGQQAYAEHPTTEVLCMAWCIGDAPVSCWEPRDGLEPIKPLLDFMAAGGIVGAHNAAFELAIWEHVMPRYGVRVPFPAEQADCTMVRAQAMALPAGLAELAMVLQLGIEKDAAGNRLMMLMTKPKSRPLKKGIVEWYEDQERIDRLKAYCVRDVEVERAADKKLPPLSKRTRAMWLIDQRINRRGVMLDLPSVRKAREIVEAATRDCNAELETVTGGHVNTVTNPGQMLAWMLSKGTDAVDTTKATVTALLADPRTAPVVRDEAGNIVSGHLRRALELKQEAGLASTKKLKAMVLGVSRDGRARGTYAFHGAATGRWAGRRIQLQNLPRPDLKQPVIDEVFEAFGHEHARDVVTIFYGPPIKVISSCLRGMAIAAPGHELIAADFSNIEGRTLAWLAGEAWKLQAFRDFDAGKGADLYILAYARAFGIDPATIDKDSFERQIGKVMELALGYGGGFGAFASMAANYGITALDPGMAKPAGAKNTLTADEVEEIKHNWREAHPETVEFWHDLERCAMQAVRHPGNLFTNKTGKIRYMKLKHFLLCRLPSGRTIAYHGAHIASKKNPWTGREQPELRYNAAIGKHWLISGVYGGLLAENVTQAVAADIQMDAMARAEAEGFPVVMHSHDELVTETVRGLCSVGELESIMSASEPWAAGLPVVAKGWAGPRYRK